MTNKLERLEQILGGKFERSDARLIPGTAPVEGVRIVYFSDNGENGFRQQFNKLVARANPRHATSGGVNERGCKISLHDGQPFHAIGFHGDVEGWAKDIEIGARELHLLLAEIEGDQVH